MWNTESASKEQDLEPEQVRQDWEAATDGDQETPWERSAEVAEEWGRREAGCQKGKWVREGFVLLI